MAILSPIYRQDTDALAVQAGESAFTYGRLCSDIDAMAGWLIGHGLQAGDRVSIHVEHPGQPGYWDWVAHLGAIRAGLVHSTGLVPQTVARSGALGKHAAAIGFQLDSLRKGTSIGQFLEFAPQSPDPLYDQIEVDREQKIDSDLEKKAARLLSTSGTTGIPKVVAWDSAMIAKRITQVFEASGIDASTRLFPDLGFPTTAGFRYPLATWQKGGTVLLPPIGTPTAGFRPLVNSSNIMISSAHRLKDLLKRYDGSWENSEARSIRLFGGRVPSGLRDDAIGRACCELLTNYGSTETGNIASGDSSLIDRHPGAAGFVRPSVTVQIVDSGGAKRQPGEEGVVRIKTDAMCSGYLGLKSQPDGDTPFRDGWFYPGDLGFVAEDGMLAITGRTSETINIGGRKISTAHLESQIDRLLEVHDVCVFGLAASEGDMIVVAIVCDEAADLNAIKQFIRNRSIRKTPFRLVRVNKIPRNAMGKAMRKSLAQNFAAHFQKRKAGALSNQCTRQ